MDKAEQPTIMQAKYGASYNRNLDRWVIYEQLPDGSIIPFAETYGYDKERVEMVLVALRTTSLAAQDGLDQHFPTGLRQRPMQLATTDEVFEGPVFCDCYCGESFAGSDEQEARQLWAEHALSAIKEQHHD
jgi:hypothetical protein